MTSDSAILPPEVDVEPLGDLMINFLIERDREEAFIDFKRILDISKTGPFAKTAKDIFAFSNYGGGYILLGFSENSKSEATSSQLKVGKTFLPIGLPEPFHIDQADLQAKFNAYSSIPIEIQYREFLREVDGLGKRFAAIYISPSRSLLTPVRDGFYTEKGKSRLAFRAGSVLFRRGTQSVIASDEEISLIKKRIEDENYRISLLSGQPDLVQEPLFSNLFDVTRIPEVLWLGPSRSVEPRQLVPSTIYVLWNDQIITFEDLKDTGSWLQGGIEPSGVWSERLSAWMADDNRRRVIIRLLNKELRYVARRIGLVEEPEKQKFYYPCDGEYREETWTTRFGKPSTVKVAQRIQAKQLQRSVFWHSAVIARFTCLDNRLVLRLSPTLQITYNGREALFGPKEGTVITRLTYNRYNAAYLNSLLFWIFKLSEGKENIALAKGRVLVSSKLVESRINAGIMFDRPAAEPVQETPEIEIGEEE